MKNNLLFDFTVDKSACTVFVKQAFATDLALVWNKWVSKKVLQ